MEGASETLDDAPYTIVRRASLAYEDFIRDRTGSIWARVDIPKYGSRTFDSCIKVWNWCKEQGIDLKFYFRMVNEAYTQDWLKKTFRRTYVPWSIAASEKALIRTQAMWRKPIKTSKDAHLRQLRQVLDGVGGVEQRKFILQTAGWISPEIKSALLEELQ